MMMSFMGSIAAVMDGSGLDEVISVVYGKNSLPNIKSGKAVSRAIRAHVLVEAALVSKLLSDIVKIVTDMENEEMHNVVDVDFDSENEENDEEELINFDRINESFEQVYSNDDNTLSPQQMQQMQSLFDSIYEHPENAILSVDESPELLLLQNLLDERKNKLEENRERQNYGCNM